MLVVIKDFSCEPGKVYNGNGNGNGNSIIMKLDDALKLCMSIQNRKSCSSLIGQHIGEK